MYLDVAGKLTIAYALGQDYEPLAFCGQPQCHAVLPGEDRRLPIHDEVDEEDSHDAIRPALAVSIHMSTQAARSVSGLNLIVTSSRARAPMAAARCG